MRKAISNPLIRTSTAIAAIVATCGLAAFAPGIAYAEGEVETTNDTNAAATPEDVKQILAGRTVFLDPGHQGTSHTEDLSRQVPDGRGGTKDCQTTGATSKNGVPEHTINWDVANLVKASIEDLGGKVVLSRADDTGWGGCIDERAKAANESGADLAVSIHSDSTEAAIAEKNKGFHLIVPTLPVPDKAVSEVQASKGLLASTIMRDAYLKSGFNESNYAGKDGLQSRADIAGPALTKVPLVFLEMGNSANTEDAAVLETDEGQLRHAVAIITGIVGYLLDRDPYTGDPIDASAPLDTPVADTTKPAIDPEGGGKPVATPDAPTLPTADDEPETKPVSEPETTPVAQPVVPVGTGAETDIVATASPVLGEDSRTMTGMSELLRPLLDILGLGSMAPLTDSQMYGLLTNLTAAVLDDQFKTGGLFPTAPAGIVEGDQSFIDPIPAGPIHPATEGEETE